MNKNLQHLWVLICLGTLISFAFVFCAAWLERNIQGPLEVPGSLDFKVYLPGKYAVYYEASGDKTVLPDKIQLAQYRLANVIWFVEGHGYLSVLKPGVFTSGGVPYFVKGTEASPQKVGIPFGEFEILWPGNYVLFARFLAPNHAPTKITVGPKELIVKAACLALIFQTILFIILIVKVIRMRKMRLEI